jgi:hypothetical protein
VLVTLFLSFGGELFDAVKAERADFTEQHDEQLRQLTFTDGMLRFTNPRWRCHYLGKGEEKACYLVRDHNGRVFVIEVIDENSYRNGRFVGGAYFLDRRAPRLAGVRFDPHATMGLRFTGLVKAREFVHGYEWARFQWRPDRRSRLDPLLTAILQTVYDGAYRDYARRYDDVHERNVLFEVRGPRRRGVPMLIRDAGGRLRLARIGVQPVDVR